MIDPSLVQGDPFNAPTPGQSLTDTPGQWGWEKPSIVSDPQQAYEGLVESLKGPVLKESLGKLMYIGVTIETLVSGLVKKGFAEGAFSPDVAELIKPLLARYLIREANKRGIKVNIVNEFPKPPMSDEDTIDLLRKFNPKEFMKLSEKIEKKEEKLPKVIEQKGFMDMGDE